MEKTSRGQSAQENPRSGEPWIQITFTLDVGHYRALWDLAEVEHLTVAGLARQSVINFLEAASLYRESGTCMRP